MTQKIATLSPEATKHFFIEMLTRDISITDAVLDLVDNSLQNLVQESELDVTKPLVSPDRDAEPANGSVSIWCSKDRFRIEDTCGGVSSARAGTEMFVFGNTGRQDSGLGLGVYGIGMKRAFFKIGDEIVVHLSSPQIEGHRQP
jgi:hypothetical protein